jgi:hypothetical protein
MQRGSSRAGRCSYYEPATARRAFMRPIGMAAVAPAPSKRHVWNLAMKKFLLTSVAVLFLATEDSPIR